MGAAEGSSQPQQPCRETAKWDKSSDLIVFPTEIPIGPIQLEAREQRSRVISSMKAHLLGTELGRKGRPGLLGAEGRDLAEHHYLGKAREVCKTLPGTLGDFKHILVIYYSLLFPS